MRKKSTMKIINGNYSSATVYTTGNTATAIDAHAIAQFQMLCDNPVSAGICIMPDVHPGKVGMIGLTMTISNKIMPNLTGIDIGCGISLTQIKKAKIEFQKLDTIIREQVPSGMKVRKSAHPLAETFDFHRLLCHEHINTAKARLSLGTLGGGNHFIEINQDDEKNLYAAVHSGSRHLGKDVTEYYLKKGYQYLKDKGLDIPYELTYLEGELMDSYLHDVKIVQEYASLNRNIMISELLKGMKWKSVSSYDCIHNYIEFSEGKKALRKGAISAHAGEKVIIPIHMRDGILLGTGLGNAAWNESAPHGSGRIMKREDIKNHFTLSQFKTEMKGIYSPNIRKDTLDKAPFAYRNLTDISNAIKDTVKIDKIIRPVYNFKAGGND